MIVNSLADLDIVNPTLLQIVKQILVNKIDMKAQQLEVLGADTKVKPFEKEQNVLYPLDCAMFMTSFTRSKMFDEVDLLESLEAAFLSRIDEANGPTVCTIFNSHATWAAHIID